MRSSTSVGVVRKSFIVIALSFLGVTMAHSGALNPYSPVTLKGVFCNSKAEALHIASFAFSPKRDARHRLLSAFHIHRGRAKRSYLGNADEAWCWIDAHAVYIKEVLASVAAAGSISVVKIINWELPDYHSGHYYVHGTAWTYDDRSTMLCTVGSDLLICQ